MAKCTHWQMETKHWVTGEHSTGSLKVSDFGFSFPFHGIEQDTDGFSGCHSCWEEGAGSGASSRQLHFISPDMLGVYISRLLTNETLSKGNRGGGEGIYPVLAKAAHQSVC